MCLPGYLIRFAPPAFGPHRQARSSRAPSPLTWRVPGYKFYSRFYSRSSAPAIWWSSRDYRISPLPRDYPRPLPPSSPAVSPPALGLGPRISAGTYRAGYGRFRPNNRPDHPRRGSRL